MYAGANTPNFLHAALDKSPCAPFFKERRMRFLEPIGLNRKFGAMGHPSREEGLARDDRAEWIRNGVLTQTLEAVPFTESLPASELRARECQAA